jgi:hypothetical protein
MKLRLFGFLILSGLLFSCDKIIFREIKCRDFQITGENYWFPLNVGDSVVFVNSSSNIRKKYTIVDKRISHRTKYTSDTGCGCLDNSGMLLTSGTDSLWFNNELRYVEDNEGNYYEDIIFVINGKQSGFYETSRTKLNDYILNSVNFLDVEFFECKDCNVDLSVKKLYRVKNLGIISFELVNGEVWINENLTKTGLTTMDSFEYSENSCD